MPVHTGKDSKGCFARWGSSGKKYYYACNNASARGRAKVKAAKQGAAAHAAGYKGNKGKDISMKLQTITANFTGMVRHDKMEGRDFLVAPMIMAVEGVLDGSDGALLYPAEELKKYPAIWNYKPVVVYHPKQGISACDPDILTNRKVGVIMNASFEDGNKLKAEAWMEEDRMSAVDERIAEAIENQEMMELSTGLFAEVEKEEGEWKGIPYIGIARNYRPDHLALLPDLKGACSIEDGAGFLRLNAKQDKIKIVGNEMSHSNIRSLLNSWLQEKDEDVWVEDIYSDFFVFMKDGKLFKGTYSITDNTLEIANVFEEVIRVTEYRTKDGAFVGNKNDSSNQRSNEMKKKELVDNLISNESTKWIEDDRKALMGLSEKVLERITPMKNEEDANEADVNATVEKGESAVATSAPSTPPSKVEIKTDKAPAKEPTENKAKVTVDEYINKAPEEIQGVLRSGLKSHKANKARLVKIITANERNQFTEEQLNSKELVELQSLAILASNTEEEQKEVKTLNFRGQLDAADVSNEEEEPLETPKMNFDTSKSAAVA